MSSLGGFPGLVDLGGCPPRPLRDPYVRIELIWLFISCLRYAALQAASHTSEGKTVALQDD